MSPGKFGTPEGMTYPTKDEWDRFPPANYVNPESRRSLVIGVEVTITFLAALFVMGRFYARTLIKHRLGWDDWLMLSAMICATTVTLLHCMGTQYALGLHIWDIKKAWVKPTGILSYVALTFFAPTASLAKISMSLTHLRILPSSSDRIFARCAIVFSICYAISITFVSIFQCSPIHAYWSWNIQTYKCIKERPFNYSAQALNSASDFLIFLWPIRTLWTVRVPIKQRLILIFVFSVGSIVCLVGIFRIYYLYKYFHDYDIYYTGAIIAILHSIETNLAIICGCLPGIKPILTRLFPNQFGSSADRTATTFDFSHRRLPGARLSIRDPPTVLSHRPSTASMVEVPIKLDSTWSGMEFPPSPPVAVIRNEDQGRLLPPSSLPPPSLQSYRKPKDPHPGKRMSGV